MYRMDYFPIYKPNLTLGLSFVDAVKLSMIDKSKSEFGKLFHRHTARLLSKKPIDWVTSGTVKGNYFCVQWSTVDYLQKLHGCNVLKDAPKTLHSALMLASYYFLLKDELKQRGLTGSLTQGWYDYYGISCRTRTRYNTLLSVSGLLFVSTKVLWEYGAPVRVTTLSINADKEPQKYFGEMSSVVIDKADFYRKLNQATTFDAVFEARSNLPEQESQFVFVWNNLLYKVGIEPKWDGKSLAQLKRYLRHRYLHRPVNHLSIFEFIQSEHFPDKNDFISWRNFDLRGLFRENEPMGALEAIELTPVRRFPELNLKRKKRSRSPWSAEYAGMRNREKTEDLDWEQPSY